MEQVKSIDKIKGIEKINFNLPKGITFFKFFVISAFVVTMVAGFHVWSRYKLIEINLQMSDVYQQLKDAEQEQRRLKIEISQLKTPSRIEDLAKRELGMNLPTKQQIIMVGQQ